MKINGVNVTVQYRLNSNTNIIQNDELNSITIELVDGQNMTLTSEDAYEVAKVMIAVTERME